MTLRTQPCPTGVRLERLNKAEEFWRVAAEAADLAEDTSDVSNASATLFISSGIASADVSCCARPGEISRGEDHRQAVGLLKRADPETGDFLSTLLGLKTKAACSHVRVSPTELKQALRAAEHLLATARRVSVS